jgi:phospholipid-binding lipoprotein MlaA
MSESTRGRRRYATGLAASVLAVALTAGCAGTAVMEGETHDPFEPFNRAMFDLNDALDKAFLGPISELYVIVTPSPVRRGVTNFFVNLAYPTTIINQFLQGKVERGMQDIGRFVFNSTFGLGGLIDFAGGIGIERHEEDFGQTLAVWGFPQGPYLELPIFGPRTTRHAPGMPADAVSNPLYHFPGTPRAALGGTNLIDTRANLESAIRTRDETALDRYVFQREAYLQRRRSLIYDGDPPLEDLGLDDLDPPAGSQ